MEEFQPDTARQVAQAVAAFERRRTGHAPGSVTVVVGGDTLVITLHATLSQAEADLAKSPAGAAKVREFHRQLFAGGSDALRQEVKRITGAEVGEATAEIDSATGTVVGVFTTGTIAQVFPFAEGMPAVTRRRPPDTMPTESEEDSGFIPGSDGEGRVHKVTE